MSFPRQQSQWVNIWGPEWHFCKSEWQSGSFVNMSGRGDMTTKLGLHGRDQPLHHLQPLFKTSIFALQASMDIPLRFFTFLGHFYRFYAYLTASIEGFTFWIRFVAWAVRFVGFIDLEQYPFMGFSHLYMITPFCISFKLWNLYFCS